MINMSYGEDADENNLGRFIELANELVFKHNVLFVASAGTYACVIHFGFVLTVAWCCKATMGLP